MASGAMHGFVVDMINIRKTLNPFVGMLGIVHAQDMHDHLVDNLGLTIHLGVEVSVFGDLCVQQ
jgi:hypothetical protein